MREVAPEFIITTRDDPSQRVVSFSDLYPLRETITSLTMIWDVNSYHVNVEKRFFIINGGRALKIAGIEGSPAEVVYARRNKVEYDVIGSEFGPKTQSYLLGIRVATDKGIHEDLLHVQSNGRFWTRKNSR